MSTDENGHVPISTTISLVQLRYTLYAPIHLMQMKFVHFHCLEQQQWSKTDHK